ncbi:hypothetical protein [Acinetobacter sp. CE-15]|uniref:hypothetical protein n=1 Tax=Acinetobacter sp. CE-15 TaxID=3425693 RepID=UPI003DA20461
MSMSEYRTISSHMIALGKIKIVSDDKVITTMIRYIAYDLQERHKNPYSSKSTPLSLERWNNQIAQNLIQYCNYMIGKKKPEWQILAEHNGWTPPK